MTEWLRRRAFKQDGLRIFHQAEEGKRTGKADNSQLTKGQRTANAEPVAKTS